MIQARLLFSIDSQCGKFDKALLPQQSMMELLVQGFDDVGIAKDKQGNFIPIEEWSILEFGADGTITDIEIDASEYMAQLYLIQCTRDPLRITEICFDAGGSIDFQFVPGTVTSLTIIALALHGKLNTLDLPRGLCYLNLMLNEFLSEFSTAGLPEPTEHVDISDNRFEGSLLLSALPPNVVHFRAPNNGFSGALIFRALPECIDSLILYRNQFCGKIDVSAIPPSLTILELYGNCWGADSVIVRQGQCFKKFKIDDMFRDHFIDQNGEPCAPRGICLTSLGRGNRRV